MLDRLRSLQAIHTGAATAKVDLEEMERQTEKMEAEIGEWRSALEKVEGLMVGVEEGIRGNVEVVGGLVRGVEERLASLAAGGNQEGGGGGGGESAEKGRWWGRKV